MIKKTLLSLALLITIFDSFGQTLLENQNRSVYNRIEYFFNLQQADSIYALGSENFKKNVSFQNLEAVLQYFFQFGKIKEAKPVTLEKDVIGYNLTFADTKGYIQLGVDSTYKYHTLIIKDQPYISVDVENINSNVNKISELDFYVDSIAKSYLSNPNTVSLSIGVIHKNKINTYFYGETDKNIRSSLPTGNTLYEIGSISKVFTSILLANLVENNIISLEDTITKYLPDSLQNNPSLQKITFKHLANHTSGLPRLPINLEKSSNYNPKNPYAVYNRELLYSYLKGINLTYEPGENYEYSNLGFGLLGELLQQITNKNYHQNITETITIPLGMMNTVQTVNPKTQQLVKVYDKNGKQVPMWDFDALAGAGALKSTVNDLLRFAQYQFKIAETPLEHAMALTKQFTFYLPPNTDIGLAWHMNMYEDVISYWHNGNTGGSSSYIAIIPDLKSAIIVLSNSELSVDHISNKIIEKVLLLK